MCSVDTWVFSGLTRPHVGTNDCATPALKNQGSCQIRFSCYGPLLKLFKLTAPSHSVKCSWSRSTNDGDNTKRISLQLLADSRLSHCTVQHQHSKQRWEFCFFGHRFWWKGQFSSNALFFNTFLLSVWHWTWQRCHKIWHFGLMSSLVVGIICFP